MIFAYNSTAMDNLWTYLQGLSLSVNDRRWLANRLVESTKNEEQLLLDEARMAIEEMRKQSVANGNSAMTLEEINNEISMARRLRKQSTEI